MLPFIYWVTAPIHSFFSKDRNKLRIKFNLSLESVIRNKDNMRVIKLKEFWDTKDSHLVINDRITEMGMIAYCKAIDASFKYNVIRHEQFMAKKLVSKAVDQKKSPECTLGTNVDPMRQFFHWHSSHVQPHMEVCEERDHSFNVRRNNGCVRRTNMTTDIEEMSHILDLTTGFYCPDSGIESNTSDTLCHFVLTIQS